MESASRGFAQLGLSDAPDKMNAANWGGLNAGHRIGEPAPLFPRKDRFDNKQSGQ